MLARAMAGTARGASVDVESDALAAHAIACTALKQLEPRARIFERRALERHPERRIYGPKMSRRVLDYCDALQTAVRHCAELGNALSPARRRREDAEEAALAAAAAIEAAKVADEDAATAARAREEEIARLTQAHAEARQRAASNALSGTLVSAQMQTDSPAQGFRSQWPETGKRRGMVANPLAHDPVLDGLAQKMARVMPRASTSW